MHNDPPILICTDLQTEYVTEGRSHVMSVDFFDMDAAVLHGLDRVDFERPAAPSPSLAP